MSKVQEILKGIYDETVSGCYIGGSLDSSGYVLNCGSYSEVKGYFSESREETPYTNVEKYWWCMCYVKYKTPTHHFYESSLKFIEEWNKNLGSST